MKKMIGISLVSMLALCLNAAESGAKEIVKKAAQTLGAQENYSWKMNSRQEGMDMRVSIDGKTQKDGLTQITLNFGDRKFEAVLKSGKVAFKQEEEWMGVDEMEAGRANMARRLQQTFKAPAGEAENLAEKSKELKAEAGGLYTGDLTEEIVKEYLSRYTRRDAAPTDVKGTVKFWVKDGTLQKYEFNLQGTVNPGQDQEMKVNRTMTTEIKDVGTTQISVPEAAKKKLQ